MFEKCPDTSQWIQMHTKVLETLSNVHMFKNYKLQSNSVIKKFAGPSILVRCIRDIVIAVEIYVTNSSFGTKKPWLEFFCYNREFFITLIVITEFDSCQKGKKQLFLFFTYDRCRIAKKYCFCETTFIFPFKWCKNAKKYYHLSCWWPFF